MINRFEIRLNSAPTRFRCAPDWSWAPRALPDYDLWFVAAGRGEVRFNGEDFALQTGVCFVWRPGDTPLATHEAAHPLEVFGCHFDWVDEPLSTPRLNKVRDARFFESSAHRSIELWARGDEAGRAEARRLIESLLWQLADEANHPRAHADAPMETLAALLLAELGRA